MIQYILSSIALLEERFTLGLLFSVGCWHWLWSCLCLLFFYCVFRLYSHTYASFVFITLLIFAVSYVRIIVNVN